MKPEKTIETVQALLKKNHVDGWLLYDFHSKNNLIHPVLQLNEDNLISRRFFYWIPQEGTPVKILHKIESQTLDNWPGVVLEYLSWQSLRAALQSVLKNSQTVAMEYSKDCAIPYLSTVDGGTIDLVEGMGVEVVSSSFLLAHLTSVLTQKQIEMQKSAAMHLDKVAYNVWREIKKFLIKEKTITEYDVQTFIVEQISEGGFVIPDLPICAVNEHAADPHFAPDKQNAYAIKKGDFILIDLWCKEKKHGAVFGDITRVALAGNSPSKRQLEVFELVRKAQITATEFVRDRVKNCRKVKGYEVDDICRSVIEEAGFGDYFIHRTGHSIDTELHGSGPHIDNLEMHDDRELRPGMCFSVEPGIYLPDEFGVRLEYDVVITHDRDIRITGGEQNTLLCLF